MSTVQIGQRQAMPPAAQSRRLSLSEITSKGRGLPTRLVLHGVEGVGKTSFAAYAPSPIFLQAMGETGLETLIDGGRLGDVPHFPELRSWGELLSAIDLLATSEHKFKTLVLDTFNGFERLCYEMVCLRDFHDDWTEHGFIGYMRGYEVSLTDWRQLLVALDNLREVKKMAIIGLCHTQVKTFKNPEGADYDRYAPDMHAKAWSLTHKWADIVLFGTFFTVVEGEKKGKASGGQIRTMYTERHAAYDAKNRLGLPETILMGTSGAEAWQNFLAAMKAGRESSIGKAVS